MFSYYELKMYLNYKYLDFRFYLVKKLIGKDPAIMNITITDDIIKYNKLYSNPRTIMVNTVIKHVSDRQSFVFQPSRTNYVN